MRTFFTTCIALQWETFAHKAAARQAMIHSSLSNFVLITASCIAARPCAADKR